MQLALQTIASERSIQLLKVQDQLEQRATLLLRLVVHLICIILTFIASSSREGTKHFLEVFTFSENGLFDKAIESHCDQHEAIDCYPSTYKQQNVNVGPS